MGVIGEVSSSGESISDIAHNLSGQVRTMGSQLKLQGISFSVLVSEMQDVRSYISFFLCKSS